MSLKLLLASHIYFESTKKKDRTMKAVMKKTMLIWVMGIVAFASKAQVVTNADHGVNFRDLHTFAWLNPDIQVRNPLFNNELITRNIENYVNNALVTKGLKIDNQTPDILLKFHTYTENAISSMGGYPMWGGWGFNRGFFPFTGYGYGPYQYTKGTLVIDAIDARTNKLIWQGGISGSINAAKIQRTIYKGVNKIMKKYPVS